MERINVNDLDNDHEHTNLAQNNSKIKSKQTNNPKILIEDMYTIQGYNNKNYKTTAIEKGDKIP